MNVYVLHRHWDTPENEGNDIIGVYYDAIDALADMRADAEATKAYYSSDFWEEDMTWESEREIYLGSDKYSSITIYYWEIVEMEVK